jgi:fatty acid desaturase
MHESTKPESAAASSSEIPSSETQLSSAQLLALQRRSDREGLLRLAGHLAAMAASAGLYSWLLQRGANAALVSGAGIGYGFTLVTMFAALHESVHRTAFGSRWLNDGVGWFAGVLSFYNSTFYRYYHGWHHRFTQIPGRDPELDDPKPTGIGSYLKEMSGYYWWLGKLQTYACIALGRVEDYPYLNDRTRPLVVRSVRLQLLVYGLGVALSVATGRAWFVSHWLLPVALGQPLLRFILLAEHTGCSQDDNAFTNTRTTHTVFPVRFLMWEMPYHAEHHRYPALPFFALARAHAVLAPQFVHVARKGYVGVHLDFLSSLGVVRSPRAVGRPDVAPARSLPPAETPDDAARADAERGATR